MYDKIVFNAFLQHCIQSLLLECETLLNVAIYICHAHFMYFMENCASLNNYMHSISFTCIVGCAISLRSQYCLVHRSTYIRQYEV